MGKLETFFFTSIGVIGLLPKLFRMPAPPGFQQYSQHNPYGYRHPSEQGLISEDILIKTSDNLKLKGWFLKQKSDY